MKRLLLLATAVALLASGATYRILVVTTLPSRSHANLAKGIVDPLLGAGHQVTWVSAYGGWKPHQNLTVIEISETLELAEDMIDLKGDASISLFKMKEKSRAIPTMTVSNKAVRETVVKDQYDAVVTEWSFQEVDSGYAAVQQVPWILLTGIPLPQRLEALVHDIGSVSTVPSVLLDSAVPMGFWDRILNSVMYLTLEAFMMLDYPSSSSSAQYEKLFSPLAAARGVPLPPYRDSMYNISILFVNSHPSVAPSLSLPPNVVHIGGYHIEESQPLPEDVKQLLDSSPEGVVYFSIGSVMKSSVLPLSLREDLIRILGNVPYKVLWKFEEDIQGLPSNIVVRKWWPQAGVLAHPNVKLFITHGGMLSTTESIHFGVPLLAIPVFGDQPSNAARAVRAGYALAVPYSENMGSELEKALKEMLSNDSYYNQATYLSKVFKKRPVHPSKEITNYIELAIESRGAYHLRSKSYYYPWYQRYMIDQLAAVLVIIYGFYSALTYVCCKKRRQEKNKEVRKNKKKL